MAKISFSKVESILEDSLRKLMIEHLNELGTIANLLSESKPKSSPETMEKILTRFRDHLKKLKKYDPKLYKRLHISSEERKRFSLSIQELTSTDWAKIKEIRETIHELKKDLHGQEVHREEDEKRIEQERVKHINKRFNIREGWLPLK
jgi:hypothetical protein